MKKLLLLTLIIISSQILKAQYQILKYYEPADTTINVKYQNGIPYLISTQNNSTVIVSFGEMLAGLRMDISVYNESNSTFNFTPESIVVTNYKTDAIIEHMTGDKVMKKLKRAVQWSAVSSAAQPLSNTMENTRNSYLGKNTKSAQEQRIDNQVIQQNHMANVNRTMNQVDYFREYYLFKETLEPEKSITGFLIFKKKKVNEVDIQVEVNGEVHNFSLTRKK